MLTTEEEATKKWCPFVRMEGENRVFDANGVLVTGRSFHCIGSDCMAWRSLHAEHPKSSYEEGAADRGYCGLAGRPELLKLADRMTTARLRRSPMPAPEHLPSERA
jgi:hypothetical protein